MHSSYQNLLHKYLLLCSSFPLILTFLEPNYFVILINKIYQYLPLCFMLFCIFKETISYPNVVKMYFLLNFHAFFSFFTFKSLAHEDIHFV